MILALLALQVDVSFVEAKLATMPKEARLRRAVFAPDGRGVAYASTQGRKEYVTVGDRRSEAFDRVAEETLAFAASKTVGYRARLSGEWIVIVGEARSDAYLNAIGPFFSSDGAAWGYAGRKRNGPYEVFLNGKKDDAFEDVATIDFAAGGAPVMIVKRDRSAFVRSAGHDHGPFDEVGPPVFTPDRTSFFFIARKDGRYALASVKETGEFFDEIRLPDPPFTPAGALRPYEGRLGGRSWIVVGDRRMGGEYDSAETPDSEGGVLAYAARRGGRRFVVAGDKKGPDYDAVGPPAVGAKGEVAYAATKGGKDFVVRAGVAGPSFDLVGGPVYSPDGATMAYPAWQERQVCVIVNGEKGEPYDEVGPIRFVRARCWYRARLADQWHVVIDGQRGAAFGSVGDPVFNADGTASAYRASKDGAWFVVRGAAPSEPFKEVGAPVVSKQGAVAFTATGLDKRAYLVMNKKKHGPFDAVWPPVFDADGLKVAFGAQTESELAWKVVGVE